MAFMYVADLRVTCADLMSLHQCGWASPLNIEPQPVVKNPAWSAVWNDEYLVRTVADLLQIHEGDKSNQDLGNFVRTLRAPLQRKLTLRYTRKFLEQFGPTNALSSQVLQFCGHENRFALQQHLALLTRTDAFSVGWNLLPSLPLPEIGFHLRQVAHDGSQIIFTATKHFLYATDMKTGLRCVHSAVAPLTDGFVDLEVSESGRLIKAYFNHGYFELFCYQDGELIALEWMTPNSGTSVRDSPPVQHLGFVNANEAVCLRYGNFFNVHFPPGKLTPIFRRMIFASTLGKNALWQTCHRYIVEARYIEMEKPGHVLAAFLLQCGRLHGMTELPHHVLFVEMNETTQEFNTDLFRSDAPLMGLYKLHKRFGLYVADHAFTPDRWCLLTRLDHFGTKECETKPLPENASSLLLSLWFVDSHRLFNPSFHWLEESVFPLFVVYDLVNNILDNVAENEIKQRLNVGTEMFTWHNKRNGIIYIGSVYFSHLAQCTQIYAMHDREETKVLGYINSTLGVIARHCINHSARCACISNKWVYKSPHERNVVKGTMFPVAPIVSPFYSSSSIDCACA